MADSTNPDVKHGGKKQRDDNDDNDEYNRARKKLKTEKNNDNDKANNDDNDNNEDNDHDNDNDKDNDKEKTYSILFQHPYTHVICGPSGRFVVFHSAFYSSSTPC